MSVKNVARRFAVVAFGLTASAAFAGPDWIEVGDAGSTVLDAQAPLRPQGATLLSSISGTLGGAVGGDDFEDLYLLRITDPVMFSIELLDADFNPVFYLFNITLANEALGLLANDDRAEDNVLPFLTSFSDDGTMAQVSQPGDYVLAIAGRGRVPVSRTGAIFAFESTTEISGPDGPGAINPLMEWTGQGETGDYRIMFEEVDFPRLPAPGAAGAMIMGGLLLTRRRR